MTNEGVLWDSFALVLKDHAVVRGVDKPMVTGNWSPLQKAVGTGCGDDSLVTLHIDG